MYLYLYHHYKSEQFIIRGAKIKHRTQACWGCPRLGGGGVYRSRSCCVGALDRLLSFSDSSFPLNVPRKHLPQAWFAEERPVTARKSLHSAAHRRPAAAGSSPADSLTSSERRLSSSSMSAPEATETDACQSSDVTGMRPLLFSLSRWCHHLHSDAAPSECATCTPARRDKIIN